MKLAWIVPESSGGIATYSEALWGALEPLARSRGHTLKKTELDSLSARSVSAMRDALAEFGPDIIHVQHEYGCFGRKIPGLGKWGEVRRAIQGAAPRAKLIATAHTVLDPAFKYDWRARGARAPLFALANFVYVPFAREHWGRGTWGDLDRVIVHSQTQRDTVLASGCGGVDVIPHFVPDPVGSAQADPQGAGPARVLVFGYFTHEKGQDLAIEAFAKLLSTTRDPALKSARLVLAGGARRPEDVDYEKRCRERVAELGISDQVEFTGFLRDDEAIGREFDRAQVVLAPFRSTSGSGSLVQAIARRRPILTSDLPLNLEIGAERAGRVPGALAFYRAGDVQDCADRLSALMSDTRARAHHVERALVYARQYSLAEIAQRHLEVYAQVK